MRNRRNRARRNRRATARLVESLEPRRLLAAAGDLDLGFGFLGKSSTTYATGGVDDSGDAVAVVPGTGDFLVGGNVWAGNAFATLTRYLANGTRDTNFGTGGTIKFTNLPWRSVREIEVTSNSIVLLSTEAAAAGKPLLHRLNAGGTADSFWVGPGTSIPGRGIAIEQQQYVLTSSALARIKGDGTLDTTFGSGGLVTSPPAAAPNFVRDEPQAMVSFSSALYVGGERLNVVTGERRAYVQRYTTGGVLDTAWAS